jgi:type III secretory pathway component EscV
MLSTTKIDIIIELDPRFRIFFDSKEDESKRLKDFIQEYAEGLLHCLGLDVQISINIKVSSEMHSHSPYLVIINNQRCTPIFPVQTIQETLGSIELATSIGNVIYDNRELLLTLPACQQILENYILRNKIESSLERMSAQVFHSLLREFVLRGLSINRLIDVAIHIADRDRSIERTFEETIFKLEAMALKLYVNKEFYSNTFNAENERIKRLIEFVRDGIFAELGIIIPNVVIIPDEKLETNEFQFEVNDLRSPSTFGLKTDEFMTNAPLEWISSHHLSYTRTTANPATGQESVILKKRDDAEEVCSNSGFLNWDLVGFIFLNLTAIIRRNAGSFFNIDITQKLLRDIGAAFPAIAEAVTKRFDKTTLTRILRDLLEEQLSIRDQLTILESLLSVNGMILAQQTDQIMIVPEPLNLCAVKEEKSDLATSDYSNFIRRSLKRYISNKYTNGTNSLPVYLIDQQIQNKIKNIDKGRITNEDYFQITDAIRSIVRNLSMPGVRPVILTDPEVRRDMRNYIKREFPQLDVLSHNELSPEVNIQVLGTIEIK